jgi:phosphoribosylanthranilate isomerase
MMRLADVQAAAVAGAHWVGVIHVPQSPRFVDQQQAAKSAGSGTPRWLNGGAGGGRYARPSGGGALVRAAQPAMLQLHGSGNA